MIMEVGQTIYNDHNHKNNHQTNPINENDNVIDTDFTE